MDKISEHISYAEATKSQTAIRHGIDNTPNEKQLEAMRKVAENCFEPLREYHGMPIAITSFFRSPEVNEKIGGSNTSQHCTGQAMDIDADVFDNGITNKEIFEWLRANVTYDQLISEYPDEDGNPRWVHISFIDNNRGEVLVAEKVNGKTKYKFA